MATLIEYGFGTHLVLDGYNCNKYWLQDLNYIYSFLDKIPSEIKMTKIMPPNVIKYEGLRKEDWGISGFVLIAESHIALHTFPEKYYLSIDIFSCKEFDSEFVINTIKKYFDIQKYEVKVFDRGHEFPHNIDESKIVVGMDRKLKNG